MAAGIAFIKKKIKILLLIFLSIFLIIFYKDMFGQHMKPIVSDYFSWGAKSTSISIKRYFGLEINNNIFKKLNTQLQTFKANITKKQRSIIGQNNLKMKKKKAKYLY